MRRGERIRRVIDFLALGGGGGGGGGRDEEAALGIGRTLDLVGTVA